MKLFSFSMIRALASAATVALWLFAFAIPARAQTGAAETEFPYVIQVETGATEFAPGDNIVITGLRGNRPHLETGDRYLLEGSYTLASATNADLAWFTTSRGPSGPTPVTEDEHVRVTNGSGNFHLKKTLRDDGWSHVSFYVNGESHGGVYFGERGIDNTVLRNKGWSDFSYPQPSHREPGEAKATLTADANRAIMNFLGNPVPPSAQLDPKYGPANLLAVFTAASARTGLQIQKIAVDDSEFPFLLYGLLAGHHDFREIKQAIPGIQGYEYAGSVVGTTKLGSTYFSLNIIPSKAYPDGQAVACSRRLMIRLQMLAEDAQRLK